MSGIRSDDHIQTSDLEKLLLVVDDAYLFNRKF